MDLQHTSTAPAASTSSSVASVVRYSDITIMDWDLVAPMGVVGVRDLLDKRGWVRYAANN